MSKKHGSNSGGKGHGRHEDDHHGHHDHHHHGHHHHGRHEHHHFGGHHGKHGVVLGTRGDDSLNGTEKKDFILGLKGDDELFGNGGNDWLFGGKGNDLLDGGAGSDKVFGGKGDDTAVFSSAENTGVDACGRETHDFYDGGKGTDVLKLILTKDELASDAVKADLANFEEFMLNNANAGSSHGPVFEFQSFNLKVRNFEEFKVVGGNTPPVGVDDVEATGVTYATDEDTTLNVAAIDGVLANDIDADGDLLSATLEPLSGPTHGTLVFNETDGSFSYTPDAEYYGPDSFSYRASDGQDESAVTTVGITVAEVNDAPIAKNDNVAVTRNSDNSSIAIKASDLLANDKPGPENESEQMLALFEVQSTTPRGGEVTFDDITQTFWYTPPVGISSDMFRYGIQDNGTSNGLENPLETTAVVFITIADPPEPAAASLYDDVLG